MEKDLAEGTTATNDKGWRARPVAGWFVRAAITLVPALAGAIAAGVLYNLLPTPEGSILWLSLLVATATSTALLLTRVAQRFAPLAFLLSLTLVFPDETPSRFKVARAAVRLKGGDSRRVKRAAASLPDEAGQVVALIAALGLHDKRTRGHSERVRVFTEMLAEELHLPPNDRNKLRWAALLHDIGKLTVPPKILNKPAPPSEEEWELLHKHPTEGMRLAAPLLPLLGPWAGAIEHHHERFDGHGYPSGLSGQEIPYGARVLAITDAYEVMTAARPYKKPLTAASARTEIARSSGSHFDPAMVRAFLNISIGRLWKGIGFAALLAHVPLLGLIFERGIAQRLGREISTASVTGALVVGMTLGGFLNPSRHDIAAVPPLGSEAPVTTDGTDDNAPEDDENLAARSDAKHEQVSRGAASSHASGTRTRTPDVAPRGPSEEGDREPGPQPSPEGEPRPEPQPEPSEEPPPETYFASGRILASAPASSVLGGATQSEFLTSCSVPHTQGIDGWVFDLPISVESDGASAVVTGKSSDPMGYNLDAFFYSDSCDELGGLQSGTPDESGSVPIGTAFVVVNQPLGVDTVASLAVTS